LGGAGTGSPKIARTTSRGLVWGTVSLPWSIATPSTYRISTVCKLNDGSANGIILAGGYIITTELGSPRYYRLWKSTNGALRWSDIRNRLQNIVATNQEVTHIVAFGSRKAMLQMEGDNKAGGAKFWRYTLDGGETWTTAVMDGTILEDGNCRPQQI